MNRGGNGVFRGTAAGVGTEEVGSVWWPVRLLLLAWLGAMMVGCGGSERQSQSGPAENAAGDAPVHLGPVDGSDLPPTDLERVAVGTLAPDFSLQALSGDTVTLSSFRGDRNVVLVFYRGHW